MKKNTALMELIEWVKDLKYIDNRLVSEIEAKATSLLSKEREDIKEMTIGFMSWFESEGFFQEEKINILRTTIYRSMNYEGEYTIEQLYLLYFKTIEKP